MPQNILDNGSPDRKYRGLVDETMRINRRVDETMNDRCAQALTYAKRMTQNVNRHHPPLSDIHRSLDHS
jgi:hypothetical protein